MLIDLLPFLYGILVSISYITFKYLDFKGGLYIFTSSCFILSIISIALSPKLLIDSIKNKFLNYRGLIFALSHIFIFIAQSKGFTSDIIVSSLSGSILGTFFSFKILNEKITKDLKFSLAFCIIIWLFYPAPILVKILGLITGVLIASLMISSRFAVKEEHKILSILQVSFIYGSIIGLLTIVALFDVNYIKSTPIIHITAGTSILLLMQFYYVFMFKYVEASKASILILSRIPFSYYFEFLVFNRVVPLLTLTLGLLTLVISLIPFFLNFFKSRISNST